MTYYGAIVLTMLFFQQSLIILDETSLDAIKKWYSDFGSVPADVLRSYHGRNNLVDLLFVIVTLATVHYLWDEDAGSHT